MRKVILAAAFAVSFTLPLTSHAQQTGAAGTQGGPPTSGSFSVQSQPLAAPGTAVQPTGMGFLGQTPMNTGGQPLGSALGQTPQTYYGPVDQTAQSTAAPQAPVPAAQNTSTPNNTAVPGTNTDTGVGGSGNAGTQAQAGQDTSSDRTFFEGPASEDPQVELSRLRAEVERLRTENGQMNGDSAAMQQGTGGSGPTPEAIMAAQPVASATFEGRVSKVSKKRIEVIDRETGETYVLQVDKDTRVRRGEKRASVTGIREGSQVRASFDLISGQSVAKRIDVLRKGRR